MGQDSPRSPLFTATRRMSDLCTMYKLIPKVEKNFLYLKIEFNCYIICDRPIRNYVHTVYK